MLSMHGFADGEHQYHRTHTDDDAQHREARTQTVHAHRAEGFEADLNEVHGLLPKGADVLGVRPFRMRAALQNFTA
jgi:hypothetical protein